MAQLAELELSYEFFPPRTDAGRDTLKTTRDALAEYRPEFYSVTFGAGGSTRDKTLETVVDIQQNSTINACPHITCVGATNAEILELLQQYVDKGIRHLVVLRGDMPSGMVGMGECKYAVDLIELIRQHFGNHFRIAAAAYPEAHPESRHLQQDFEYFAAKMNAGADLALTQYFYNTDSYFNFLDLCEKKQIQQPVMPGIMPIGNYTSLRKFSKQCGAEIPRWIRKTMAAYDDNPDAQRECGIDIVTKLCDELINNGAPGLHFYTMNRSSLTTTILDNLGLR